MFNLIFFILKIKLIYETKIFDNILFYKFWLCVTLVRHLKKAYRQSRKHIIKA